ncbi:hypothetical protein A1O3_07145 [Capronia epimyces CBS 606.96]|uniref:Chromosome segregation in meiosis protein n=1 Tax=Capronia epimyces CBS 606.96 TaxID=1182542 RepID=W9YF05_9EURO|nr:uncharacterized protein A1O3_07145 [Capronia epimyces CBS 606.96]EXJ80859.1 hypothetical protein A1O3_07145 [Capronia epimyces CBS 606.96]
MAADPLTSATVDDLFNFDSTDDEDPFKDKPSSKGRDDKTTLSPRPVKRKAGDDSGFGDDLGLDEEVKITKKRKPIAKLDEARLLSAQGIPKLRALALSGKFSKKLHLKGKGHEFSDVARLLNYYQLWLDNLYPRAKFADGLQLIEKVGHSKRMQMMRKEWIDEGKPGYIKDRRRQKLDEEREINDLYGDDKAMNKHNSGTADGDDSLFIPDPDASHKLAENQNDMPEDDDLDALLAEQETSTTQRPSFRPQTAKDIDSEGDDDLDALLAEQETRRAPTSAVPVASNPISKPKTSPFDDDDDDEEDMDDLDALLAEQEARVMSNTAHSRPGTQPTTAAPNKAGSTPDEDEAEALLNDDDDDDLDALLAEQEARQAESPRPPRSNLSGARIPLVAADGEPDVEANGDDMFSSSPVRNTATPALVVGREYQQSGIQASATASDDDAARETINGEVEDEGHDTAQPQQAIANAMVDAGEQDGQEERGERGPQPPEHEEQDKEEAQAQAEEEEEEEEEEALEAGDMFSSSPVQND